MARYGDLDSQYFDDAGDPLVSGKIYFYETGTTTPKTTYADVNYEIPNTNPVILTAAGRQPNIFFPGVAKAILATSAGTQILVRDPVGETDSSFGNPWIASKEYNANSVVIGSDGQFYVSLINGNVNNNPVTTTGSWTFLYSVEWNAGTTYKLGSVVTRNQLFYQSLQNGNINKDPLTENTWWVPINLVWSATATYGLNANVIGTDGVLYTSIQAGNINNPPATSPLWWIVSAATMTVIPVSNGGTGLSTLGTPLQYLRVNSAGTALEYGTLFSGEIVRVARTSNTALAAANRSNLIDITSGTFTQTFVAAATLGDGWFCYIRNSGTGVITLDPNASETIDGLASGVLYSGEVRLVQCDGTALRTIDLTSRQVIGSASSTQSFTTGTGNLALIGTGATLPSLVGKGNFTVMRSSSFSVSPTSFTTSNGWTVSMPTAGGSYAAMHSFTSTIPSGAWGSNAMVPPVGVATASFGVAVAGYIPSAVALVDTNRYAVMFYDSVIGVNISTNQTSKTAFPANISPIFPSSVTGAQLYPDTVVGTGGFVALANDTTNNEFSFVAGTVGATGAVTFGTPHLETGDGHLVKLADGKYIRYSNAGNVRAVNYSGTTLSLGSTVAMPTGAQAARIIPISSTSCLIAYATTSGGSPYKIGAVVATISGTTLTLGTAVTSAGTTYTSDVYGYFALSATQFLLYTIISATNTTTDFIPVSVSGTTVTFGTANQQVSFGNNQQNVFGTLSTFSSSRPTMSANSVCGNALKLSSTEVLVVSATKIAVVVLSGNTISAVNTVAHSLGNSTLVTQTSDGAIFAVNTSGFIPITVTAGVPSAPTLVASGRPSVFFGATANNLAVREGSTWFTWLVSNSLAALSANRMCYVNTTTTPQQVTFSGDLF